ncbi:MAG: integrase, partial [SAR324 cluster bacterium]|nr:integrase [SAR324 cluster bacterium]
MEKEQFGNMIRALNTVPAARTDPSRNPVAVYVARLGPGSRRTMTHGLRVVAEILTGTQTNPTTLPWHHIQYQHVQAIRARLAQDYSPATANKILSALRGVLKEAWRLKYIDSETYHRITDIERVSGDSVPAGRSLDTGELLALVNVCDGDTGPA